MPANSRWDLIRGFKELTMFRIFLWQWISLAGFRQDLAAGTFLSQSLYLALFYHTKARQIKFHLIKLPSLPAGLWVKMELLFIIHQPSRTLGSNPVYPKKIIWCWA